MKIFNPLLFGKRNDHKDKVPNNVAHDPTNLPICLVNSLDHIKQAIDGEKHFKLRNASYLFGGYVGSGLLSYNDAHEFLKDAINAKPGVKDIHAAHKTIKKCLEAGMLKPIVRDLNPKAQGDYISGMLVTEKTGMEPSHEAPSMDTPFIPDEIYHNLPSLLKRGSEKLEPGREKDVFLTASIAILSGCFHDFTGLYDRNPYAPNLYCFVVAPAASGKGVMKFANMLAQGIHNHYLELSKDAKETYKRELKRYREKIKEGNEEIEEPIEPPFIVFNIPANSSSAAVINHLKENDGGGIICETEADSMTNSLKQDWGGYSDMLRKAFHHEPISYSRKTNREYVEIQKPNLSVALSGTFNQVPKLIMSAEDGLFSRFIYYLFMTNPKWRDVSPGKNGNIDLSVYYEDLAREVLDIHLHLKSHPYSFELTNDQWDKLNKQNEKRLNRIINFVSEDASSIVFRLGLIQFRICMVLSLLRHLENGILDSNIVCEDVDFEISEKLSDVYLEHAIAMFNMLPKQNVQLIPKNLELFYNHLPDNQEFTNQEAGNIGKSMGISEKSAVNYLKKLKELGLLQQPMEYGPYRKG